MSDLSTSLTCQERFQEYIASCPHHGMEEWLIIQSFFNGLNTPAQNHIDAASGGSFVSLSVAAAKVLVEEIASNQSWKGERQQQPRKGIHHVDSIDILAAKMDLLMKKLESPHQEANQVMDSRMTCETCGETGHTGTSCPITQEEAHFVGSNNSNNSGFHPQQGWNSKPNLSFG